VHFVVLIAYAIVFMPIERPDWPVVEHPLGIAGVLVGQWVVVLAWTGVSTRRILRGLDADPTGVQRAQRMHARRGSFLGALLLLGFAACMWGTDWPVVVRRDWGLDFIYGLDETVLLLPFFASLLGAWVLMYPADRAIRRLVMEADLWAGHPVTPVWGLGRYLVFMLRHQLLIIALPMTVIVIANDFVQVHAVYLRRLTRLYWADQVALVMLAGVVLFFVPVMLRWIWSTSPLPAGSLRDRLREVSRRIRLRYREVLVWHSEGMVVNAAVMGVLPPVRYVLLSDALLERMDDATIEAVFGHEAGHVKHHHLPFYLLFAVLSMLIVGGVCEIAVDVLALSFSYVTVSAVFLVALVWGLGFGWISRRFERQADLYGARVATPDAGTCDLPCDVHRPADGRSDPDAVCACGAKTFCDTLRSIARLNGIPEEAPSWRHSSIGSRIRHLQLLATDPRAVRRFGRVITGIKVVLVVGTVIGLAIGVWLYWNPDPAPPKSRGVIATCQPATAGGLHEHNIVVAQRRYDART
jgi:STE24 endopeptidase